MIRWCVSTQGLTLALSTPPNPHHPSSSGAKLAHVSPSTHRHLTGSAAVQICGNRIQRQRWHVYTCCCLLTKVLLPWESFRSDLFHAHFHLLRHTNKTKQKWKTCPIMFNWEKNLHNLQWCRCFRCVDGQYVVPATILIPQQSFVKLASVWVLLKQDEQHKMHIRMIDFDI